MKIAITAILLSLTSVSFSAGFLLDALTGTIPGTTTTWTATQTQGSSLNVSGNNFKMSSASAGGGAAAEIMTITFTGGAVDIDVLPSGTGQAQFSNSNASNTLTADAGAGGWSFTAGTVVPHREDALPAIDPNWYTITGNSVVTDRVKGGNRANGDLSGNEDWGSFSNTGVTTFTWATEAANNESFQFCVTPVPEPTSAGLLGLGGLALLLRRSRK